MGILQEFCQAMYETMDAYQTEKTAQNKPLHERRRNDIDTLTGLLKASETTNTPNIHALHRCVVDYLNSMQTARLIGIIALSSDLRDRLRQVLEKPEFQSVQMVIAHLQEQQTNQTHINTGLTSQLKQQGVDIALLKTNLSQRDETCMLLKTHCDQLANANSQLKDSLNACLEGKVAEQIDSLHTTINGQQQTIDQLKKALAKSQIENEELKRKFCASNQQNLSHDSPLPTETQPPPSMQIATHLPEAGTSINRETTTARPFFT
jgi:predicted RNase H-like nuclease (RuvC/YqgF family)